MVYCKFIKIYNESSWKELEIDKIKSNLNKVIPNNIIEKKKNSLFILDFLLNKEKNFSLYDKLIIKDLKTPSDIYDLNYYNYYYPNDKIQKKEIKATDKKENISFLLFDGFSVQKFLQKFFENDDKKYHQQQLEEHPKRSESEEGFSTINIIITDKLLCTFDDTDWRYHARSLICGNPSLISTTGIVEGLAKPRDYYYKLFFYKENPYLVNELEREYKERFITYDDLRINDIIEGLILQSLFYFLNSGDPFCDNKDCRFYNAHFQDDIIRTNIKAKRICQKHKILLDEYNKSFFS